MMFKLYTIAIDNKCSLDERYAAVRKMIKIREEGKNDEKESCAKVMQSMPAKIQLLPIHRTQMRGERKVPRPPKTIKTNYARMYLTPEIELYIRMHYLV